MNARRPALFIGVTAMLVVFAACSLDYTGTDIADELSSDVPEIVLFDFTYTVRRANGSILVFSADRMESYSARDEHRLFSVAFIEIDPVGDRATDGTADFAMIDTRTEDVELTGSIEFYSTQNEARIFAETLSWRSEGRILSSPADDVVIVERDDGSVVRGSGFRADALHNTIEFTGGSSGRIVIDEDE